MKRFLIFISAIFITAALLSASPYRISLMTAGPGEHLYAAFGHSGLRVVDTESGADKVYNFGMFDFSTPNFYTKFLKGDLDYYVGIQSFDDFMQEYLYEGRYVYEQVLALTDEQTERILSELEYRYRPENRAYRYKFIQRNCTTELRDIIVGAVDADTEFLEARNAKTWRGHLNASLPTKPWERIGINVILGSKVDGRINNFESMFLPILLYLGMPQIAEGLVAEDITLNTDTRHVPGWLNLHYPYIVFILLAAFLVFANSRVADSVFLFVLGTLGLIILFLMVYGSHMEFKLNFNLLWCNPMLIALGVAILKKWRRGICFLSGLSLLLTIALFVVWLTGIQGFDPAFFIAAAPLLWISLKYYMGYHKAFNLCKKG